MYLRTQALPRCARLVLLAFVLGWSGCGQGTADRSAGANNEPIPSTTESTPPAPPDPPSDRTSSLQGRDVLATIRRVADWQLTNPTNVDPRNWVIAPLYDGLIEASLVTGDPHYLAAVIRAGRRVRFTPGSRTYHADGHAAGYAWLRIYLMDPQRDPSLLVPFKADFDEIVAHPIQEKWTFTQTPPAGRHMTDRWIWADSLFMSPPTFALMAKATGDDHYLRFMDAEYRFAYDALFDRRENLIYRDARYIHERTPNGQKVFWSRGNGWMLAGLALMLDALPKDYATRPFYVDVFKRMSAAVVATQQNDGFWYLSLKDPAQVPTPETSATALFTFALASGVRMGILERSSYWPVVERAWKAISAKVDAAGAVTFVQGPAGEPKPFETTAHVPFGTGAVLMAGSEIVRVLDAAEKIDPAMLREEAERLVTAAPDLSTVCKHPCAPGH